MSVLNHFGTEKAQKMKKEVRPRNYTYGVDFSDN